MTTPMSNSASLLDQLDVNDAGSVIARGNEFFQWLHNTYDFNHLLDTTQTSSETGPSRFQASLSWSSTKPIPFTNPTSIGSPILSSPDNSSKQAARADVISRFLRHFPPITYRLTKELDQSLTPKQLLDQLVAQHNDAILHSFTHDQANKIWRGELRINGQPYIVRTYPAYIDHSYAKHKLAKELIHAAAGIHPAFQQASMFLRKHHTFFCGLKIDVGESVDVEFKGGKEMLKALTEAEVWNQRKGIAKEICAFLNTKGGRLYVGVYDGPSAVVQGVDIRNGIDKFQLDFNNKVYGLLSPKPNNNLVQINFHRVLTWRAKDCYKVVNVEPPDLLDDYHRFLECKVKGLEDVIEKMPRQAEEEQAGLWLIEIFVKKAPELYFSDHIPYRRLGNQSLPIDIAEMKTIIVQQWVERKTNNVEDDFDHKS